MGSALKRRWCTAFLVVSGLVGCTDLATPKAGVLEDGSVKDAAEEPEQTPKRDSSVVDSGRGSGRLDGSVFDSSTGIDRDGGLPCVSGHGRCVAGADAQREVCASGDWVPDEPCAAETRCAIVDATNATVCRPVDDPCAGSTGAAICRTNILYSCDAAGRSVGMETCPSPAHCVQGAAAGTCPECLVGEYRCTGAALEVCTNGVFATLKSCPSAALCNATVGDCTDAACLPGQYECQGDDLMRCNDDQSALVFVKTCGSQLCDRVAGECDVCFAGQNTCVGAKRSACANDGQSANLTDCPSSTPVCVGQGRCVECDVDTDCTAGVCEANSCVACRADTDCQKRGDGTRICTSDHRCVECEGPGDCSVGECRTATCSSQGTCGETPVTSGSCGVGRVCNFNAVCEKACGNGRYEPAAEACDATSSAFDQYTCDEQCNPRTIWTPCGQGQNCISPSSCMTNTGYDSSASYCSPPCTSSDSSQCQLLLPSTADPQGAGCFGACLIPCDADYHCPSLMKCPAPGTYCIAR